MYNLKYFSAEQLIMFILNGGWGWVHQEFKKSINMALEIRQNHVIDRKAKIWNLKCISSFSLHL